MFLPRYLRANRRKTYLILIIILLALIYKLSNSNSETGKYEVKRGDNVNREQGQLLPHSDKIIGNKFFPVMKQQGDMDKAAAAQPHAPVAPVQSQQEKRSPREAVLGKRRVAPKVPMAQPDKESDHNKVPSVNVKLNSQPEMGSPKEDSDKPKWRFALPEVSEEVKEIYRKEKERLRQLMSREDREAEEIIDKYLEAYDKGMDLTDIAEKIFLYPLPNKRGPRTKYQTFPFVSSFAFEAFADIVAPLGKHSIRDWKKHGIPGLQDGHVIYIDGMDVAQFSSEVAPNITKRFILISHDSLPSMPRKKEEHALLSHPKLIHWFAKNPSINHPKLDGLPVGLNPWTFKHISLDFWNLLLRTAPPTFTPSNSEVSKRARPYLVYLNFKVSNNQLRKVALKSFGNFGHIVSNTTRMPEFYRNLLQSKFVVSPPGVGEDTYRSWESIILGAIPIVRSTPLDQFFKLAPTYILEDWQGPLTAEQFEHYQPATTSRKVALAPYWFDRINSFRDK